MINLGIIGFSKGNGHPYSFSAIFNGYEDKYLKKIKYKNIHNYLKVQKKKNFIGNLAKVTHAWSKNFNDTLLLSKACKIKHPLKKYQLMDGKVDGVIIAKDNWQDNKKIADFFLKKNIPVFLDKPLTLSIHDLKYYKKFYKKKLIMSCSGLRFSNELSEIKKKLKKIGKINFIIANITNDLDKYSIHLLEVIQALGILKVKNIKKLQNKYESFYLELEKNKYLLLNCFGKKIAINNMQIYCEKGYIDINFKDNFNAFRNTLIEFTKLIKKQKVSFSFKDTFCIINTIIKLKKL